MNVNKFNSKGTVYSKARPSYPDALFSYLLAKRVIDKNTIAADIGSGTGIFTIELAKFTNSVFPSKVLSTMALITKGKWKNTLTLMMQSILRILTGFA